MTARPVFVTIVSFILVCAMKPLQLTDYVHIDQTFNQTAHKLHPSEVHGTICGMLSGRAHDWTVEKVFLTGPNNTEARLAIQQLLEVSFKQLNEFLFEFQLLLPPEDCPLPTRAEGLTLWCQGFLTGLNHAHVPLHGTGANEADGAISDLIEIAKMDYEAVVASEEDEIAYVDLVEYVRMAVMLIYQEFQPPHGPQSPCDQVH